MIYKVTILLDKHKLQTYSGKNGDLRVMTGEDSHVQTSPGKEFQVEIKRVQREHLAFQMIDPKKDL